MSEYELKKDETEYVIDISSLITELWKGIKSFGWIVLVLAVISAGIGCLLSYRSFSPYYTAATTFTVNLKEASDGSIYEDNLRASQMSKTFPYIIDSGVLKNRIADDLGLPEITEMITAENVENTNLFTIKVTSYDAEQAYHVLQSVVKNYPEIAETVVGGTEMDVLDETGIPEKPTNSLDFGESTMTGALSGAGVGFLIILIYALTRNTIHKIEDLEKISNIKHLGSLPVVVFKKRGRKQDRIIDIRNDKLPYSYREEMIKIRSRVEKAASAKAIKAIIATSAVPGEGKSTFAFNLALSLAEENKKVVLVDCDFRRPTLRNLLPVPEDSKGIEELLNGDATQEEAVRYYGTLGFHALVCNRPMKNSSEIIDTANMHKILEGLKEWADYIILDTAPSAILSDTCDLAKLADGIIFIVKQNYSKADHVLEGLEHLSEGSDAEMLGCVLNCVKTGLNGYGYGYGYGHGYYHGKYGSYGYGNRHRRTKKGGELITNEE